MAAQIRTIAARKNFRLPATAWTSTLGARPDNVGVDMNQLIILPGYRVTQPPGYEEPCFPERLLENQNASQRNPNLWRCCHLRQPRPNLISRNTIYMPSLSNRHIVQSIASRTQPWTITEAPALLVSIPVQPPRGDAIQKFSALELPIVRVRRSEEHTSELQSRQYL